MNDSHLASEVRQHDMEIEDTRDKRLKHDKEDVETEDKQLGEPSRKCHNISMPHQERAISSIDGMMDEGLRQGKKRPAEVGGHRWDMPRRMQTGRWRRHQGHDDGRRTPTRRRACEF